MAKKPKISPVSDYYEAVRKTFDLQAEVLSRTISHSGEKGRNNEEFLKEFLRQALPKKFEIGTGFILSSDMHKSLSRQVDIVIYDNTTNSPLFNQLAFGVFPIESVYGTIEVKTRASAADLRKSWESIAFVRGLAQTKRYIEYGTHFLDGDPKKPVTGIHVLRNGLPPRSYVFAYDVAGWTSLAKFSVFVRDTLKRKGSAHLHGLCVIKKDWFLWQRPFTPGKVVIEARKGDALLRFYREIFHGVSSFPMKPGLLDDYLPGLS